MKNTRKLLCLIMVLAVMSTLTATALAENENEMQRTLTNAYDPVNGNTGWAGAQLKSTMTVGQNPDNAILRITQRIEDSEGLASPVSGSSARGVTSYTFYQLVPNAVDIELKGVYVAYEVYGGTAYDSVTVYKYHTLSSNS